MCRAFRTNLTAIWTSWWDSRTYQILQYYCYTCQFDILLSMTTENLSDALMYGSYHSGITATRTSQHCGKLSENSVYSVSGTFIGQVDFAETTEMKNRNGNRKKNCASYSTASRTVFILGWVVTCWAEGRLSFVPALRTKLHARVQHNIR